MIFFRKLNIHLTKKINKEKTKQKKKKKVTWCMRRLEIEKKIRKNDQKREKHRTIWPGIKKRHNCIYSVFQKYLYFIKHE